MATESTLQSSPAGAEVSTREHTRSGQFYRPIVDIIEQPGELVIFADMPGVRADSIDIHFEDGALTIHGRVPERPHPQAAFLLQEYGIGDFYRVFQISEAIDSSRISAEYADGVLTLHLPKVEAVKPRKIDVQVKTE
jgi:HSP20 family protein